MLELSEGLTLSPSGVSSLVECPRKFFYQHGLQLKGKASPESLKGKLIHKLLEALAEPQWRSPERCEQNVEALTLRVTQTFDEVARLRAPAEATNASEGLSANATEAPMTPETTPAALHWLLMPSFSDDAAMQTYEAMALIRPLLQLSVFERLALQKWVLGAVADLKQHGFFMQVAAATDWQVEQKLTAQQVFDPALNTTLMGIADVVVTMPEGRKAVLDYKTYGDGKLTQKKPETRLKHVLSVFEPLSDDEALTHAERFKPWAQGLKLFQLPLYALMLASLQTETEQAPAQPSLALPEAVLQLVRPAPIENPDAGSLAITLTPEVLARQLPEFTRVLQQHLIAPLRQTVMPEASPNDAQCKYCVAKTICDAAGMAV